jgi:hypothetical protein
LWDILGCGCKASQRIQEVQRDPLVLKPNRAIDTGSCLLIPSHQRYSYSSRHWRLDASWPWETAPGLLGGEILRGRLAFYREVCFRMTRSNSRRVDSRCHFPCRQIIRECPTKFSPQAALHWMPIRTRNASTSFSAKIGRLVPHLVSSVGKHDGFVIWKQPRQFLGNES